MSRTVEIDITNKRSKEVEQLKESKKMELEDRTSRVWVVSVRTVYNNGFEEKRFLKFKQL